MVLFLLVLIVLILLVGSDVVISLILSAIKICFIIAGAVISYAILTGD